MPKTVKPINLDDDIIEAIENDRGMAPFSTYVNFILQLFYSDEHGFAEEIRTIMEAERSRGPIPEFLRALLKECLDDRLRQHGLK